ncbi:MAG TPA: hypothetical protein VER03_18990 [Bryobacteraceae bacterium]|nr:hypothetical protein [Bryobacteraceae bacterium]
MLKSETAAAMIANQNAGLNRPYGIGWEIDGSEFAEGCSDRTVGSDPLERWAGSTPRAT